MTPEMIELAKRAVACKGWRWMPGMLGWRPDNHGVPHTIRFVVGVERMEALAGIGAGPLVASGYATCDGYWRSGDITPDLTDPATLGCLLALVREAWGAPRALVRLSSNGKSFHVFDVDRVTVGGNWAAWLSDDRCPTEAHALVAALEGK